MKTLKPLVTILCSLALLLGTGCKDKTTEQATSTIDFLRGDLLLCGSGQFGEVSFSLSCDLSVRESFDLAVSLLHSFEYAEAEKAFVNVIDVDPDCAMAYWGVAMSIYHALWKAPEAHELKKGAEVLNLAAQLQKTQKEQDYLDAIGAYYANWETVEHKVRAVQMEKKMEEIFLKYPDDTEAAIFYALALKSTADRKDKNHTNERKAGKILEAIFPDQPNHPGIAHYIIHNYDNPELAPMALTTARRYADIAPTSAHAQHMPSHIFTRLGLWVESINSNLRSADAARCYADASGMEGHWTSEMHALDYLLYAYLQTGNTERTDELYAYISGITNVWGNNASLAYPFAANPARMALENKDWTMAAQLKIPSVTFSWEKYPWEKAIVHFTRILGATRVGDIQSAEKEMTILQSLHKELSEVDTYKADQVMIQIKASQAWISLAKGDTNEAVSLMQESVALEDATEKHPVTPGEVIPAYELLGDLLLTVGKPEKALEAYEINLKKSPNRFNGIYGAGAAAKEAGDQEKAKTYFKQLIELTKDANSTRPEIEEAKIFIDQVI